MTIQDIMKRTGKTREEILEKLIDKQKINKPVISSKVILSIKIICLIISAASILLSIYFSQKWIVQRLPNLFLSWTLSSVIVLFLSLSWPARELLLLLGFKKEASAILWLSIIIMAYSMISSVIGQFDQIPNNIEQVANKKLNVMRLQNIDDQITANNKKYEETYKEKDLLLKTISELRSNMIKYKEGDKEYSILLYQVNKESEKLKTLNSLLSSYDSTINKLNEDKTTFLNSDRNINVVEEQHLTFFAWVQSIFSFIDKDALQLIIFLFPAIFIDIAAPFCLKLFVILSIKKH